MIGSPIHPEADVSHAPQPSATRPVTALMLLSIRRSVRSRLLLALLILCAGMITFVPLAIQGDGTPEGYLVVFVRYALGGSMALLSLAAVWVGCLAINAEFEQGSSELLFSKPPSRWSIWTGNLAGAAVVLTVVMILAAACIYGLVRLRIFSVEAGPGERSLLRERLFVARRIVLPRQEDYTIRARRLLQKLGRKRWIGAGMARDEALRVLQYALAVRGASLAPGQTRTWIYDIGGGLPSEHAVLLKFRGLAPAHGTAALFLNWTIREGVAGRTLLEKQIRCLPGREETVVIPTAAVAGVHLLSASCTNPRVNRVPVTFDPATPPRLEIYAGRFEANYLRSVIILCANLVFLCSLGMLCGCIFSLPTAAFTSLWLLLMVNLAPYFHTMAGKRFIFYSHHAVKTTPTVGDHFFRLFFSVLDRLFYPLRITDPLKVVAEVHAIPWGQVIYEVLFKAVVAVLVMSLAASLILGRRQYVKTP